MNWKEQDRIAEDSTAHLYDYLYNRTHFAHAMYRDFAYEISARVKSGNVLELACGTGTVSKLIKTRGTITHGIDHSPRMIEIATTKMDYPEVGDIENLPYQDNQFDAIFVHSALHHFPDLKPVLSEAHRVLKSGRLFFIQEPNKHHIKATGILRVLRYAARHLVKQYPDVSHLEIKPSEVHDTITMDQVLEPLRTVGFSIIQKQYCYDASWLLSNFDSAMLHKFSRKLDKPVNDGYMFRIVARK